MMKVLENDCTYEQRQYNKYAIMYIKLNKAKKYNPCWLGCMIYSYGWWHMYENVYSVVDKLENERNSIE